MKSFSTGYNFTSYFKTVEREARTPFSRYRKTKAMLEEILLIILKPEALKDLPLMRQGRNSDGSRRKEKYMLDLENLEGFRCHKISF